MTPEEIAECKAQGKLLRAELIAQGVSVTGVGITAVGSKTAIHLMVTSKEDRKRVPKVYGGYPVNIVITGPVVPR